MITNDKTRRAIEAIKTANYTLFHGDLTDYVIECLESLKMAPDASEAILCKNEIDFILSTFEEEDQSEAIHSIIDDFFEPPAEEPKKEELPPYQLDEHVLGEPFKMTHTRLNWITGIIFVSLVCFLKWGV